MEPLFARPIYTTELDGRLLSIKPSILACISWWTGQSFVQSSKSRLLTSLPQIFSSITWILAGQPIIFPGKPFVQSSESKILTGVTNIQSS